ncbi:hypothetical protein TNCV_4711011 [Trichonephila clavipes]|uniref:Uncharacterized protein n=1 Tax=Trichonephila clavipes TaxID=2585209 RepID=A0A8X6RSM9_TRICX|nr:hypothetical protein TNCV_4711011 [Trichonephila clavipes]
MLKAKGNDRRKNLALGRDEFRKPRSNFVRQVALVTTQLQPIANISEFLLTSQYKAERVVKVTDLWPTCHEFMPSTPEDPPCREAMHGKSVKAQTCPPIGLVWKAFGKVKGQPTEVIRDREPLGQGAYHCTPANTQLQKGFDGSFDIKYSILFVCATKVRLSKQQDEDHERDAAQRYPTHVQSVTYPANTQAKEEAVPAANQDRI